MRHFAGCLCPFCIMDRAVARRREQALRATTEFGVFSAGDVRRALEQGGAFAHGVLPPGEVRKIAETLLGRPLVEVPRENFRPDFERIEFDDLDDLIRKL